MPDISRLRMKFQHKWDFIVHTNYSIDLLQARYSLQQESLNSDDMLLYITSEIIPSLEGSLIESKGQKWIVASVMKEVNNQNLYQYLLYPVTDTITIKEVSTATNAIGTLIVDDLGKETVLDCFVEAYSLKERTMPTAQPVESYQQTFFIAANQLPDYRGAYVLSYRGLKYKLDSFERSIGLIKIRATEDL